MSKFSPSLSPSQESALRLHTAQITAKGLTKAQVEGMRRIRDRGPSGWCYGQGRAGGAVKRMFDRLVSDGLVAGPPYKLTTFGKRVLAALDAMERHDGRPHPSTDGAPK